MRKIRRIIIKWVEDKIKKARNALRPAEITTEKKEKLKINTQKKTKKTSFKKFKAYLKARL